MNNWREWFWGIVFIFAFLVCAYLIIMAAPPAQPPTNYFATPMSRPGPP